MKHFKTVLFFVLMSMIVVSQNLKLDWAISYGDIAEDLCRETIIDDSGFVYVTGQYEGTVDYDPGSSVLNFVSNGLADIFIQKLDPKGNLIWIKSMGAGQRDEGLAIDQDGSGNLIIAGEFRKTVDFDPGPSVLELTSIGSSDAYVLKLNRNGNFIWAKSMGGKSNVWASQIAADKDNNVYLIGGFRDTADFDPGISNYNLISVGDEDIFIQKLDSNGNFLWAKSVGGIEQDIGFSLSLDNSGNVYVCGEFRDSVDFDPGLGTHYEKPSNLYGSYLLKLNSNGDFIWVNTFSGSRTSGRSLSIDNKGDIVLTGRSGSNGTSYVAKLDSSGNNLWSNSSGNNSSYVGSVESKIDLNGNIFVLGEFFGQVDFNPGSTQNILSSYDTTGFVTNLYLQKFSPSGELIWVEGLTGTEKIYPQGIAVNDEGIIYVNGGYKGTYNFNPSILPQVFTSNGSYDAFLLRLNESFVGIKENQKDLFINIFPNPTSDETTISLDRNYKEVTVRISDISGRVISASSFSNTNKIKVSIPGISGMYFVDVITTDADHAVLKVIKR